MGESERLTKARKASCAIACASVQDEQEAGHAMVHIRDCLDTIVSGL